MGDKQKFLDDLSKNLTRQTAPHKSVQQAPPRGGARAGGGGGFALSNSSALPRLPINGGSHSAVRPHAAAADPSALTSLRPPALPRPGNTGMKPASNQSAAAAGSTKGSISMLQEYVQCSKSFHIPSNYPILQWSFDTQMADSATLKFRAIVAFLLEGVPHHVAGAWQQSKKHAQRDAAERALCMYVGKWGSQVFHDDQEGADTNSDLVDTSMETEDDEAKLVAYCRKSSLFPGSSSPKFVTQGDDSHFRATVEVDILGVPHKLGGAERPTEAEARADAARRVLWYVQCPGYDEFFEPEPLRPSSATAKIAQPPGHWVAGEEGLADEAMEVAERKTAVMRVQNRLQQKFSQQLRPGQSVWEWAYETDPTVDEWPPAYKAAVQIPVLGRRFVGKWARGQREAQLDTIQQVVEHLDALDRT